MSHEAAIAVLHGMFIEAGPSKLWNTQTFVGHGVPHVGASQQSDLLLQRHLVEECLNSGGTHGWWHDETLVTIQLQLFSRISQTFPQLGFFAAQ
jgi:hypothetical protein